jgi:integrase
MSTRTIVVCDTHGRIKAIDRARCDAAGCSLTEKTQRLRKSKGFIKGKRCSCSKDDKNTCEHSWWFQRTHGKTPDGKPKQWRFPIDDKAGKHIAAKADAEDLAADYWKQIKAGTLGVQPEPGQAPAVLTLSQLITLYVERKIRIENPDGETEAGWRAATLKRTILRGPDGLDRPLGEWPITAITPDDVERFKEVRLAEHGVSEMKRIDLARSRVADALRELQDKACLTVKERQKLARLTAEASELAEKSPTDGKHAINRCLQLWRAVHNWAILKKYSASTPFKIRHEDGAVSAVQLFKERKRRRRFEPGERERLIAACSPHLRVVVEVALETCCRKGELLSLQWSQVDFERNELFLPAEKTKSDKDRWVPMTARARALLDMRKTGPDGQDRKPTEYVFGNEVGEQIGSIKTAWRAACRRAGIKGLHFHDLRREAASTLLEGHVSENVVQEILGHADISTTSTYLATTRKGLHAQMRRFEALRAAREKDAHEDAHTPKAEQAEARN